MNASLARRIRNAEADLIYALDSRRGSQRDPGRRYGPAQRSVNMSGRPTVKQDRSRTASSH